MTIGFCDFLLFVTVIVLWSSQNQIRLVLARIDLMNASNLVFCVLHVFSETINWHEVEQWQSTIVIFGGIILILRALCGLTQASMDDRLLLIILSLACGFILLTFCKDYLKDYVDLSKI